MRETERTDPADEFRQGDIIRLEDGLTENAPSTLGIIINADCDLVHGKLDGVIAYLPIYPFQTYFTQFWIPKYVEEMRRSYLNKLRAVCKLSTTEINDLVHWLSQGTWQQIYSQISTAVVLSNKQDEILREALEALVMGYNPKYESHEIFDWRCSRDKSPEIYVRKQINRALRDIGDGHLFISDLVGHDGIGFVIRMRRIYTIDVDCCFPSESDRLASTGGERLTSTRCARLAGPFRFKFAQMFAYQFSRIGLPDDIVSLNQLAVDDLSHSILEQIR